ncbi:MAG: SDR family oxidoreductase [Pseudomonadales bacterium]|nr:SDR family oxidoreductase [Pseudomonadales bacterium]MCP5185810.1 SDR family oxidoreductase [Pseudomonadales bacterium]
MSLQGKQALITGAGSGIGRASAMRFHQGGAGVMCADIDLHAAEDAANHINQLGGRAEAIRLDVRDREAVRQALHGTIEALGDLNVLFNNAGVGAGPDWDTTLRINLDGVYNGLYYGCELMAERGGGAVINTASILGLVGPTPLPGGPILERDYAVGAYAASKGAVVQLTRQFALSHGSRGVRVNALAPGYIVTPMTALLRDAPEAEQFLISLHPMGRLGRAEEIANAAAFLASDEASFINGVILPVDGGYTAR